MTTLRERMARVLVGPEYRAASEQGRMLREMYEHRAGLIQTEEVDQRASWNIGRHANQILLSSESSDGGLTETERLEGVKLSRRMYHWDVLYKAIIRLWTNFGFGRTVTVTCRDERAQEVWGEFWDADRNRRILGEGVHTLSHRLLVDGEFFPLIFTSKRTGLSTVRIVKTDQIGEVVGMPDDQDTPVWFKRTWTPAGTLAPIASYYKHWAATDAEVDATPLDDGVEPMLETDNAYILMQHAALPGLYPRGVPLLLAGQIWSSEYADFLQDRRAVTKLVAMMAEDMKVVGGSRAVDMVKSFFDSGLASGGDTETNPHPAVGGPFIHNDAVNRSRSPLTTGAGDAMNDGAMFLGMVGMSGGVFSHYLGMGEAFRLATATSMEWPTEVQWELYRNLWASIWRTMVRIVLSGYSDITGETFEDMSADVSTDALMRPQLSDTASALNTLYLNPVSSGKDPLIPYEVAITQALRVLNVPDSTELVEKMVADKEAHEAEQSDEGAMPEEAYERIEQLYQEALAAATTDEEKDELEAAIELVEGIKDDRGSDS